MIITLENDEVINLLPWQEKVIQNDIPSEIFESDMIRRCHYVTEHPVDRFIAHHKEEWRQQLQAEKVEMIPTNPRALLQLVMDRPSFHLDDPHITRSIQVKCNNENAFQVGMNTRKIMRKIHHGDDVPILKNQMAWILQHKFERCLYRLRREWEPRLESLGIALFPASDEDFVNLIFSRPEYKNRSTREAELKK